MSFRDHFSTQSAAYAQFRPRYPAALIGSLAELAPSRERAWDCATGSGQVAVELAGWFREVIATDASARQIEHAQPQERVRYRVLPAEQTDFEPACFDLVTVAQALHWLDLDRFYAEVRRTLRPGGVVAVWSYGLLAIDPELDPLIAELYHHTVGPCWPPERAHVDDGYARLAFPFTELTLPSFEMSFEWNLAQLLGYLGTWSAVQKFKSAHGRDPLADVVPRLAERWGESARVRAVRWPLAVKAGRVAA